MKEALKAYAASRYNDGFGWECFSECWDDADWDALVAEFGCDFQGATLRMNEIAELLNEQYAGAQDFAPEPPPVPHDYRAEDARYELEFGDPAQFEEPDYFDEEAAYREAMMKKAFDDQLDAEAGRWD